MSQPRHNLREVQALAKADEFVVGMTRAAAYFDDAVAARAAIASAIGALGPMAFAHTDQMPSGPFDVYGVRREDAGWYLKLAIVHMQGRRLFVVSFHPLEFPLQTRGGTVQP